MSLCTRDRSSITLEQTIDVMLPCPCSCVLQAVPQVQVVESVKVHAVETVNVVPQDRESNQLKNMCLRTRHTSVTFGLWYLGGIVGRIADVRVLQPCPSFLNVKRYRGSPISDGSRRCRWWRKIRFARSTHHVKRDEQGGSRSSQCAQTGGIHVRSIKSTGRRGVHGEDAIARSHALLDAINCQKISRAKHCQGGRRSLRPEPGAHRSVG